MTPRGHSVVLVSAVVLALGFAISACALQGGAAPGAESGVRFLSIEGDVDRNVIFNTGTPVKNDAALPGDQDFEGTPLTDFISQAGISGTPREIYFQSSGDGFCASAAWEGASEIYVIFSAAKGWCLAAPNHPPAANAIDVDRLIVVSENSERGLAVTRGDGGTEVVSFGEILISPLYSELHADGTSELNAGGDKRSVTLYTRKYAVNLADVRPEYADTPFIVLTENGGKYLSDGTGRFIIYRQTIDYMEATGDLYENVSEIRLR